MADLSYYENEELEDEPNDDMEDDYEKDEDAHVPSMSSDSEAAREQKDPQTVEKEDVELLMEYANCSSANERHTATKILLRIFQNAAKSKTCVNVPKVFEPVNKIISDPDVLIRSTLIECLLSILILYHESPDVFSENPTKRILGIATGYLLDSEAQVRQDATGFVKKLLDRELLDEDTIQQDLCKVIVDLSQHTYPEFQTLALSLMTRVNQFIGDELTEKLFLDRFLKLCESEGFFVRRVCASIMGEFCTMLSKDAIYHKLLHAYAKLCLDSVWSVRKTTVDVMMSVARCVPLTIRRHLLSKLLIIHLRDESRWVRRSAYEILGPFISTFAKQFHNLICDQKGELVLVHENERGWPRFNVVPVAKFTDILSENLNSTHKLSPAEDRTRMLIDFKKKNNRIRKCPPRNARTRQKSESDYKTEESDNFNTFKYYYNPPDTLLDMDFVKSIISDNPGNNDNNTNTDENVNTTNNANNESDIYNNFNNWENRNARLQNNENDSGISTESLQQTVDSNENNANYEQNEQQEFDSNDSEGNDNDSNDNDSNENDTNYDKRKIKFYYRNRIEEASVDDNDVETRNSDSRAPIYCIDTSPQQYRKHSSDRKNALDETYDVSLDNKEFSWYNISLDNASLETLYALEIEPDDEQAIVPPCLVNYFVSMAEFQSNSNESVGPDLDYHCAYSFPAVVLTLGQENWPQLKDAYQSLTRAMSWKVRSTLASSIHEIAMIIGQDYTARDLVPIFNGFIKDLDEVRIGALRHFGTFLNVLSPQDRTQYLSKLNEFLITDSKWNWRLREELVKQLSRIINLYQCADVAQYISPLLLQLMQDRVAAVRHEALVGIGATVLYLNLHSDDALSTSMLQEMRNILKEHSTERWIIRQTYALICQKLITNLSIKGDVFARELLPYLFELSSDKVPNVRLVVARTFNILAHSMSTFFDAELMNEVREKLREMQQDTDRDVRMFACNGLPSNTTELFKIVR